jgi:hypothetical protein
MNTPISNSDNDKRLSPKPAWPVHETYEARIQRERLERLKAESHLSSSIRLPYGEYRR